MGADGYINIDSRLNPEGFQEGMNGVLNAAEKGMAEVSAAMEQPQQSIARTSMSLLEFQNLWGMMAGDQRMLLLAATVERVGDAFNNMTMMEQQAAMAETIVLRAAAHDADVANGKVGQVASTVENKVVPAHRKWGTVLREIERGFRMITVAIFPSTMHVMRASRGVEALGQAATGAFTEMTAGEGAASIGAIILESILGAVVIGVLALVVVVGVLTIAFVALSLAAWKFFENTVKQMAGVVSTQNQYGKDLQTAKSLFADIQGACAAAFAPLFEFALPYIKAIVAWLISAFNTLSMILASVFGQKQAWQYVAGTVGDVDKNAGAAADNAERLGEAADGALASFDKLDVLQQNTAENTGGGPAPAGGEGQFILVDVNADILKNTLKDIGDFFQTYVIDPILVSWTRAWNLIKIYALEGLGFVIDNIYSPLAGWWMDKVVNPLYGAWLQMWTTLYTLGYNGYIFIRDNVYSPLAGAYMDYVVNPLYTSWLQCMNEIYSAGYAGYLDIRDNIYSPLAGAYMDYVVSPLYVAWVQLWDEMKKKGDDVFAEMQISWSNFKLFVNQNILTPLSEDWKKFYDSLPEGWRNAFASIGDVVKAGINTVIDDLNRMITNFISGLNQMITIANTLGKAVGAPHINPVPTPQIPRLATGAVIPPNSPFLAMLGDQSSGRNLEMPEDTLRQILREENGKDIKITATGALAPLVRLLKLEIDREATRVGPSLIDGATS